MGGLTTVGSVFVVGVTAALMGESFSLYLSPDEAHVVCADGTTSTPRYRTLSAPNSSAPTRHHRRTACGRSQAAAHDSDQRRLPDLLVPMKPRVYDVRYEASSTDR